MDSTTTKPLAIISGGAGYIGAAIAEALSSSGWRVVSLSRSEHADAYVCDVTDEKAVRTAIADITAKYGQISACIHAASPALERTPILSISTKSFDSAMDTGARAAFLLAKEVAGHLIKGAAFIGITTQAIEPGIPQVSGAYTPSKYALRGFLRVLSAETTQAGVRVYAVAPGFLPGGLNSDLPPQVAEFIARKSGTDTDSQKALAALVVKLCTDGETFPPGSSIAFPSLELSPL